MCVCAGRDFWPVFTPTLSSLKKMKLRYFSKLMISYLYSGFKDVLGLNMEIDISWPFGAQLVLSGVKCCYKENNEDKT